MLRPCNKNKTQFWAKAGKREVRRETKLRPHVHISSAAIWILHFHPDFQRSNNPLTFLLTKKDKIDQTEGNIWNWT
jgi:hypothetical protein